MKESVDLVKSFYIWMGGWCTFLTQIVEQNVEERRKLMGSLQIQ